MAESLQPFSCIHTPDLPDLLQELGCTLALSTYQAGKVILVSPKGDGMVQIARNFQKPMGMTIKGDQLAIATHHEVVVLANSPELARAYPKQPGKYDGLFVPRTVYYSGELDLHDMAFGDKGLWAVNTRFSCLVTIDSKYSFTPQWQPPFISQLTPDDRCHLNGMAMKDGAPEYVTGLGETNTPGGWRENKLKGGFLMHVPSNEFVVRGLAMPHSPRIIDNTLFFLNSATGELMTADPETGKCESINKVPGFVRGMSRYGDYLFIGISKIRQRHMFSQMDVAKQKSIAGIAIIHIPSGRIAGTLQYLNSCEEIYDVQVIPGLLRPGILNHTSPQHQFALTTPQQTFWGMAEENLKASTGKKQEIDAAPMQTPGNETPEGGSWHVLSPRMAKVAATTALAGALFISEPPQDVIAGAAFVEQTTCPGHAFCQPTWPITYNSAPVFVDLDVDNDLDLFVGESGGSVQYFLNTGSNTSPAFAQQTGASNPLNAHSSSGSATPAVVDIDNDGDFDVVIGESSGSLKYYENDDFEDDGIVNGTATFTEVTGASSPFYNINVSYYSAPTFVDIDGDGDFDMFIGADYDNSYAYGSIRFFENDDFDDDGTIGNTPTFTQVTTACPASPCNPLHGIGASFGNYDYAPVFVDFDGDSDVDAFLGQNDGTIDYYQNPGGGSLQAFTLQSGGSNPFDGVDVGSRSKITFMDIDNDGARDALIGKSGTDLSYFKGNTLDSWAAPTDPGSGMYTLEDIFQRMVHGTAGSKRAGSFTEPSTEPGPTGHTLNDVMTVAPAVDDVSGAQDAEVCSGKTYWSLRSGTWGLRTGTKSCP